MKEIILHRIYPRSMFTPSRYGVYWTGAPEWWPILGYVKENDGENSGFGVNFFGFALFVIRRPA